MYKAVISISNLHHRQCQEEFVMKEEERFKRELEYIPQLDLEPQKYEEQR